MAERVEMTSPVGGAVKVPAHLVEAYRNRGWSAVEKAAPAKKAPAKKSAPKSKK